MKKYSSKMYLLYDFYNMHTVHKILYLKYYFITYKISIVDSIVK